MFACLFTIFDLKITIKVAGKEIFLYATLRVILKSKIVCTHCADTDGIVVGP